jgi:methionyl-tRNA synthetase
VTYVWFDALVNYLSFAGYDPGRPTLDSEPPAFRWPALHVIGKDILIPAHGIYWPIMLKALGFAEANMPTLLVHGWWNVRGKTGESEKMSKSLGNVVDPNLLADKYGTEAVRYYLMSDIATGRDADFSEERLVQRYNAELANSLGNLLNRTLSMAAKYRDTRGIVNQEFLIKRPDDPLAGIVASFPGRKASLGDRYAEILEKHQVSIALEHSWEVVTACNALIDAAKPWTLAKLEKGGDDDSRRNLDAVLYHLAESLRIIAILVSPVLPRAAAGIFEQLNWNGPMALAEAEWGKLPDGHVVGKPTPLFPRIEAERPSPH